MGKNVVIVGGGPAGLFCSYLLLKKGFKVDLYDQSTGLAKKFLVAGKGGLNLTHSENLKNFAARYGKDEKLFAKLIHDFAPEDLRQFCSDLGVETFVGTSGRVFPKKLKAAQILSSWSKRLKEYPNFHLYLKHSLVEMLVEKNKDKRLVFETPEGAVKVDCDKAVLALGGASWKRTGSDGKWKNIFERMHIPVKEFQPMNCGFEISWSPEFVKKVDRSALKNILLSVGNHNSRGEAMLTPFGIEGGGIYALSNHIRNEILKTGKAEIVVDLKPDLTKEEVADRILKRKNKNSLSNHLRKSLGLGKAENALLRETLSKETFNAPQSLAEGIKALPLTLERPRPLEEAISTSGGVAFSALDEFFQIKTVPGVYVAGEMLDFEAPTGGYLLQGCFSTAHRVVQGILAS